MDIRRFIFNPLSENTLIVSGVPGKCAVIDPGYDGPEEREALLGFLRREGLVPDAILITHGHNDHVCGAADLQQLYGIPVYMSAADWPVLRYFQRIAKYGFRIPDIDFSTTDIADGQTIKAGGLEFKVIATPGHSPGCVCYLEEDSKVIFTGDTLFAGAIGRTDLYLGDYEPLIKNVMEKLMTLPGDITVYPGHGGPTTIGEERMTNPFLEPFNEPEETDYDQD